MSGGVFAGARFDGLPAFTAGGAALGGFAGSASFAEATDVGCGAGSIATAADAATLPCRPAASRAEDPGAPTRASPASAAEGAVGALRIAAIEPATATIATTAAAAMTGRLQLLAGGRATTSSRAELKVVLIPCFGAGSAPGITGTGGTTTLVEIGAGIGGTT